MRRFLGLIIFLLIYSLLPVFAFAADDPLSEGIRLYNNSEYDQALEQLNKALTQKDQYSSIELAECHRYIAMVHLAYVYNAKAQSHFLMALELNPNISFDPALTSPKIMQAFEEAKKAYLAKHQLIPAKKEKGEEPKKESVHTWRWPAGWTLVGVGGTCLLTSGITYGLAWDAANKYDAENEDQDRLDSLKSQGTTYLVVSGATFGTGLVLTGLGVYFLATEPKAMASIPVGNTHVNLIPAGPVGTYGFSLGGRF